MEATHPNFSFMIRPVLGGVKAWFDDPSHWAEYEAWHIKKYGRAPTGGYGCPKNRKEESK